MDKIDHSIGYLALDWLQWGDEWNEERAEIALKYMSQLKDENARLKAEKEQWEPQWVSNAEANAAGYNQALDEINQLKAENARYRKALEFYAENPKRENGTQFSNSVEEFGNLMGDDLFCVTWEPILDLGRRAREVLKGGE